MSTTESERCATEQWRARSIVISIIVIIDNVRGTPGILHVLRDVSGMRGRVI